MDFVSRIKDSVFEYLSPKRRRTIGTTTPNKDEEARFAVPHSDPQGSKAQAFLRPQITKKYIINPRKRGFQEDEEDTVVTLNPADSVSQGAASDEEDEIGSEEEVEEASGSGEEDVEDDSEDDASADLSDDAVEELDSDQEGAEADVENSVNRDDEDFEDDEPIYEDEAEISAREAAIAEARVEEFLAQQAELALIRENIEKVKAIGDWHPDALTLFERFALRSFETVLPSEFRIDFPTLPEDIFAPSGTDTFINTNCCTSLNGVKALQGLLLRLGIRARERLEAVGSADKVMAKGIQDYIKWSERDGGYDKLRFLPVLVVVAARPNQSIESLSTAIKNQMAFLAEKHREYLALPTEHINEIGEVEKYKRQPPLLYGMIVAQAMVIFVTMDSSDPDSIVKHLSHVDFKEKPMDVWNGLAVAFVCIMARNYIMSIKDELEDESEEIDPDL